MWLHCLDHTRNGFARSGIVRILWSSGKRNATPPCGPSLASVDFGAWGSWRRSSTRALLIRAKVATASRVNNDKNGTMAPVMRCFLLARPLPRPRCATGNMMFPRQRKTGTPVLLPASPAIVQPRDGSKLGRTRQKFIDEFGQQFRARGDTSLAEDRGQVRFDRAFPAVTHLGNLGNPQSLDRQQRDLEFGR